MSLMKKTFLLVVGVIAIAFDEVSDSIQEALESLETQRKKINQRIVHHEP